MENLFAYGTLMCEDIMEEVSGCRLPRASGTLRAYCRRSVKGERFPALLADEGGSVQGVVYRKVPAWAWERLDRFEGEMYERRVVQIELEEGAMVPAAAYVVKPEFVDQLDPFDWDFADFLRNGKERFQKGYRGFLSLA